VITEDSGVYTCKAVNNAGEAVSSASLKVKCKFFVTGACIYIMKFEEEQLKILLEGPKISSYPCSEILGRY
jgi:hypothetical protein